MKTKKEHSNIRKIRMDRAYYERLQKRADGLDMTFSSYIRAISFLDLSSKLFEKLKIDITTDGNFVNKLSVKCLVRGNYKKRA